MTLLIKRNAATRPALASDLFNTNMLLPSVFDFDGDLFDFDGGSFVVPNANIAENDKDFRIDLAAPGLERKDFKVEVDNGILSISAEKEEESEEENKNFRRREFSYNSFRRSFSLPDNSVPDKIDAKYENGVLRLVIPKKEVSISKPVKEIKVS
jgi:HSP20 family protein